MAREVLLDLLLQSRCERDPGLLVEPDVQRLRIGVADANVEAGIVALRLEQMAADGGGQDAQVGDVHPGRVEAGDHRPLDHSAGVR